MNGTMYRVKRVINGTDIFYRIGLRRSNLPESYPIYGWLPELEYKNGESDPKAIERLIELAKCDNPSPAGVYAIKSKYVAVEEIQYVGQSVVLDTRVKKHLEGIEISRALIDGELNHDVPWPVPLMYKSLRELEMDGNDLNFIKVNLPYVVYNDCYRYDRSNRLKPGTTLGEVLTVLEQFLMDNLSPKLNAEEAKPTKMGRR